MNNFRQPKRTARGGAIDGMLRPRKSGQPSGVGNFKKQAAGAGPRTQMMGDFKRPNGFRPAVQPNLPATQIGAKKALPPVKPLLSSKTKKKHPWRQVVKRTAATLAVLLLVGGGYVGAKAYIKTRNVLKGGGQAAALQANVDPTRLNGEGDGRINILMMGKGGAGHDGPDLTDTLVVASIDPVHKTAALVSVPRDLWVQPAGGYGHSKINAVYANAKYAVLNGKKIPNQNQAAEQAGEKAIGQTIQATLGIPIHYYGMVDFAAFQQAIDSVGGVDMNVPTALVDPTMAWVNNWNSVLAPAGHQHFNGNKALLYVRSRHGSARGDFDRSERQRQIMVALKDKILTIGTLSNPLKISQLIDAFGDHVQTNFGRSELARLYGIAKQIPSSKVTSVGLADPPNDFVTTGNAGGQSVVLPKAGVDNYAALQSYIRNTLKDSYIADENASMQVLNGTTTVGLATTKANELKSYGYNVTVIGDAPTKAYPKTLLVDLRHGAKKYTKHYLETRLGVKATTSFPAGIQAGTADFVIILGQTTATNQ